MLSAARFRPATTNVRALLASGGTGALTEWVVTAVPRAGTVCFVDTGAVPMREAPFVAANWASLSGVGLEPARLDLTRAGRAAVEHALDEAVAVFVTGGYPAFLLEHAQRSGFVEEVASRVKNGDLAYIGVSAGAALAGPDMAPLIAPDDPGTVTDTACMALVPFVIIPHVNRRPPEDFATRQKLFETTKLMPLNDDQAIIATANALTVIPSP